LKYVVGIDIGGTFTDLVCVDESGNFTITKTPSTPADPGIAVIDGLKKIADKVGKTPEEFLSNLVRLSHGTTVSTNTVLTWTGAKVGLLCTKGFRDILEIRFGIRENVYDYRVPQPKPLVPRYLRVPIEERYNWNGEEIVPLNEDDVRRACMFFREQGVEAVAICFLWSFRYHDHEKRAAEIVREELPGVYVCASIDVQPEVREYWRMSTTVLNAYVGPALSTYVKRLVDEMKSIGFKGTMLIVQSNAGVISPEVACEQAVRTLLSGPASGPGAGLFLTQPLNINNFMTIDMGGTSFDVCLVKDGVPMMATASSVGGFYHLRLPLVDVNTIGSGGGSIAWLDSFNVLHVGPQSAGANPGPASYGRGGEEPTCTDADLILGYLNPDYFLGGEIVLNPDLARKAIKEKIADPLGLSVIEAARSIKAISDHAMVDGISMVSVRRGEDPKRYSLLVAGGAGPVHAASLARQLGITRLVIPRFSSIFCALGGTIADIRHDYVNSLTSRTRSLEPSILRKAYNQMKDAGIDVLSKEAIDTEHMYFEGSIDIRYAEQYHEVDIGIEEDELTEKGIPLIVEKFHRRHEELYGYRDVTDTEILNLRLAACGKVMKPSLREMPLVSKDASKHLKMKRDVYFEEEGGFISTPIYDGDTMEIGNQVNGPAIVEQATTTIVVPPRAKLEVNQYGDYVMELLP
jgi:N-methylhydantoinase A